MRLVRIVTWRDWYVPVCDDALPDDEARRQAAAGVLGAAGNVGGYTEIVYDSRKSPVPPDPSAAAVASAGEGPAA